MISYEVNFDGLVGPTHNYAGLAHGNLAAMKNKGKKSNPKLAALEGLAKMKFLLDLGIKQAVLPPHERPSIPALRQLGFHGADGEILAAAQKQAPHLLAACCSASAMWTANAATISPSADSLDGRLHITPANLVSQLHRSLEASMTARILKTIFADEFHFAHHARLPAALPLADEGAANHMRLSQSPDQAGLEIFTYGRSDLAINEDTIKRFAARQTLEASQAVARSHVLSEPPIFLRQNPAAIDAGAFHNDVVAVSHGNVLLYHPQAWADGPSAIQTIRRRANTLGLPLVLIEINARHVSLSDAIQSYLFNSQIVTLANGSTALIAPAECRRIPGPRRFLDWLLTANTPIRAVHYVPVRQSMRNGGGPACLRLRILLTEREFARTHSDVFLTPPLYNQLTAWVNRHYRDEIKPEDLADPTLLEESRRALNELTGILRLGSIYDFQK